jgi:TetR/AcrR family transcriptional regulator, repressor for neighboring sulfatase
MAVARTHIRRSPEVAKALILQAAAQVFARSLPDQVGIREIAQEAGISHGLITHYFGTYDNLIDEVIEHRLAAMRALAFSRLGTATFAPTESPLLDVLVELLDDPALTRVLVWSMLAKRERVLGGAPGMLGKIIDTMHARIRSLGGKVSRARLEMSVLMSIAMVAGWSVAGPLLEKAGGRSTPYTREELRVELNRMMRAYVQAP